MDYDNLKTMLNVICDYEHIGDNPKIDFKNNTLYISNIHIKSIKVNDTILKNIALDFSNVTFSVDLYELLEKFYEVSEERLNITKEIKFNDCEFFQDTSIENSIFQESCIFKDCRFNNIQFECINVDFNKAFNIIRSNSDKEICFKSCKFLNQDLASGLFIEKLTMNNLNFYCCEIYDLHSYNNFFKNVEIINCNLHNETIFSHDKYSQSLNFSHNSIEKIEFKNIDIWVKDFENHIIRFIDNTFNSSVYFSDCKFLGKANFDKSIFNGVVKFYKTYFHHNTFFRDCKFLENVSFKRIEFQKYSYFNRTIFHDIANFSNANFIGYANFEKANFKGAVYFDKSEFENFINMANCTINDVMSFYDAKLYYTPYLAGANVDKNTKFNLMYIKQDENNIENVVDKYNAIIKISKNIQDENTEIEINKLNIVKGFRDSFRIFKSSLITNNNLLDASLYRVNELKAKELEMDLQATKLSPSQQIERYLFKIYKCTSNHHSDFLLILNWTLTLICMNYCFYYYLNTSLGFEDNFLSKYIDLLSIELVCFIPFLLIIIFAIFYKLLIKFNCLKIMNCFKIVFSMIFVFCFSVGIYNQPSVITPFIGVFSDNAKNHFLNKSIINLKDYQAISIAKRLNPNINYLNESQAKKDLLASKDIIKEDEKILKAYDNALQKGKNADEIMARINIIYYILMILCLFSLQKTARKNSIIPS